MLCAYLSYQRLADRRAANQRMQGGIIERLGGEIWRQESTTEVRDNANVRTTGTRVAENKLPFFARSTMPPTSKKWTFKRVNDFMPGRKQTFFT